MVQVDDEAGEMVVGASVKAAVELVEKRVTCAQPVTNKNVGEEKRAAEQMVMDGEQKGAPAVDHFLCHRENEDDRMEDDDKVHTKGRRQGAHNGGEGDNEETIQVCSQVITLFFNSFSRCFGVSCFVSCLKRTRLLFQEECAVTIHTQIARSHYKKFFVFEFQATSHAKDRDGHVEGVALTIEEHLEVPQEDMSPVTSTQVVPVSHVLPMQVPRIFTPIVLPLSPSRRGFFREDSHHGTCQYALVDLLATYLSRMVYSIASNVCWLCAGCGGSAFCVFFQNGSIRPFHAATQKAMQL